MRTAKKQVTSLLPRLAHPVAGRIARTCFFNEDNRWLISDLTKDRRQEVISILGNFTTAVREIVEAFDELQDEQRKSKLIESLSEACGEFAAAVMASCVDEWKLAVSSRDREIEYRKRRRQEQTAYGRAGRSAKAEIGRTLVYKCLDSLFKKKPDWLNGAGITDNRIKDEILPDVEKLIKKLDATLVRVFVRANIPKSELPVLPRLKDSTIRGYIKDYRKLKPA
jgi:hypothetical protein